MQSPNEFVDKVKREVSLESYISRYVKLKRTGKRSVGLCPFHSEKSPSFSVSVDLQLFHCFGCGKSGDIFTFIQEYEKVDFKKSLEIISEYSGIPLQKFSNSEDANVKKKLYELNEKFLSYFQENLSGSEGLVAREYLKKRGIEKTSILTFELGYALPGFDNFIRSVVRDEESIQLAQKLGLLKQSQNRGNAPYDFYRDRIIFPIKDPSGKVVGFGGRIFKDSEEAKYINSPASPIYEKGRMFYGLYQSQTAIRKSRVAILVEGYLDVIGLNAKGIETAIAPLGTSLTSAQVRSIKNYADSVKLVFDGDKAGKIAALRASEICLREGVQAEIVVLETGVDPFDLSIAKSLPEISEIFHNTIQHSDFLLQETLHHTHKLSSPDEKKKAIESLFSFIKTLERETDQQMYLSEGARHLGLSISAVINDFKRGTGLSLRDAKVDTKKASNASVKKVSASSAYCRKILSFLLMYPDLFRYIQEIQGLEMNDRESAYLWEILYTSYINSETISPEILQEDGFPEEIRSCFMPYLLELVESKDEPEEVRNSRFEESILLQKRTSKQIELESINSGAGVLDKKDHLSRLMTVRSEILEIDQKLRALNYTNGRG